MTEEELVRFAFVLREAERVRARIARDEISARAQDSGGDYPIPVAAVPVRERSPEPAMVA